MIAAIPAEKPKNTILKGFSMSNTNKARQQTTSLRVVSSPGLTIENIRSEYEAKFNSFFGYAYSLTLSKDSSRDIVQDVFTRLVATVKARKAQNIENLEAYIITSIRNEFIKRNSKEMKRPSLVAVSQVSRATSHSAESSFLSADLSPTLLGAIKSLPKAQRMCFILRFHDELAIKEIAKQLNISESAVKTHLARGKENLSAKMKKDLNQESVE